MNLKIKIIDRALAKRLGIFAVCFVIFCLWGYLAMVEMPGKKYTGEFKRLTENETAFRDELVSDVWKLAGEIGERNVWRYQNLVASADYIENSLKQMGYDVSRQYYLAKFDVTEEKDCCNIIAEIPGSDGTDRIVVVGAHYDSAYGSEGANDNISGVAATLALARRFAGRKCDATLRFVLFVNEEPPFYHSDMMGSMVYAKSCKANGDNIVGMVSLECMGYFTDAEDTQKYPFPLNLVYPSTGNFIGFMGNFESRKFLYRIIKTFRANCDFPSEGGAIPKIIPGITWSDQWSFWKQGYPAIMVTDTAFFRYPEYHKDDTPDMIDYDRLGRVVAGLEPVIAELVGSAKP